MKRSRAIGSSIAVLLTVVVVGVYFSKSSFVASTKEATISVETTPQTPPILITMDDDGYTPNTVTIHSGESVEWVNKSSEDFWPASNLHPTHSLYPGSSIFKCLSAEEPNIFDACHPLSPSKTYSFTFADRGVWTYHDHLRPNKTGTIIVK